LLSICYNNSISFESWVDFYASVDMSDYVSKVSKEYPHA